MLKCETLSPRISNKFFHQIHLPKWLDGRPMASTSVLCLGSHLLCGRTKDLSLSLIFHDGVLRCGAFVIFTLCWVLVLSFLFGNLETNSGKFSEIAPLKISSSPFSVLILNHLLVRWQTSWNESVSVTSTLLSPSLCPFVLPSGLPSPFPLMRYLMGRRVSRPSGLLVSILLGQYLRVCSLRPFSSFRRESSRPCLGGMSLAISILEAHWGGDISVSFFWYIFIMVKYT